MATSALPSSCSRPAPAPPPLAAACNPPLAISVPRSVSAPSVSKMDKFLIEGGRRLEGTLEISGAKNAALPAMAAAILTTEPLRLENVPRVKDISTMSRLLAHIHVDVALPEAPGAVILRAEKLNHAEAPYELVKTMRASILVLGPLLARSGYARVSLPGGCAIGARPVDLHIKALQQM